MSFTDPHGGLNKKDKETYSVIVTKCLVHCKQQARDNDNTTSTLSNHLGSYNFSLNLFSISKDSIVSLFSQSLFDKIYGLEVFYK